MTDKSVTDPQGEESENFPSEVLEAAVDAALDAYHDSWTTDGRRQTNGGGIGWEWAEPHDFPMRRAMTRAVQMAVEAAYKRGGHDAWQELMADEEAEDDRRHRAGVSGTMTEIPDIPPIPAEAVEAAAKALWLIVHPDNPREWETWVEVYGYESKYHVHGRAALTAARVPEMLAVIAAAEGLAEPLPASSLLTGPLNSALLRLDDALAAWKGGS